MPIGTGFGEVEKIIIVSGKGAIGRVSKRLFEVLRGPAEGPTRPVYGWCVKGSVGERRLVERSEGTFGREGGRSYTTVAIERLRGHAESGSAQRHVFLATAVSHFHIDFKDYRTNASKSNG